MLLKLSDTPRKSTEMYLIFRIMNEQQILGNQYNIILYIASLNDRCSEHLRQQGPYPLQEQPKLETKAGVKLDSIFGSQSNENNFEYS